MPSPLHLTIFSRELNPESEELLGIFQMLSVLKQKQRKTEAEGPVHDPVSPRLTFVSHSHNSL